MQTGPLSAQRPGAWSTWAKLRLYPAGCVDFLCKLDEGGGRRRWVVLPITVVSVGHGIIRKERKGGHCLGPMDAMGSMVGSALMTLVPCSRGQPMNPLCAMGNPDSRQKYQTLEFMPEYVGLEDSKGSTSTSI